MTLGTPADLQTIINRPDLLALAKLKIQTNEDGSQTIIIETNLYRFHEEDMFYPHYHTHANRTDPK